MSTSMRDLIGIVEDAWPRSAMVDVFRFDGPKHISSTVLDKATIKVTSKDDLHAKIKAWMEEIGLDPEDEDDLSYIEWQRRK